MKLPSRTISGLIHGALGGIVLILALFSVGVILRVDDLREDLELRVRLLMALEELNTATRDLDRPLSGTGQPVLPEEWDRHREATELAAQRLLALGSPDPAVERAIADVRLSAGSLSDLLGSPAAQEDRSFRAEVMQDSSDRLLRAVRGENAEISALLNHEWKSLYAIIYASLGLASAVLVLLCLSRLRTRRFEDLQARLQQELALREHLAEELRNARREHKNRAGAADLEDAFSRLRVEVDRKERAEAEAARIRQELVQAQKMESLGKLAGGVAHDFNNLLASIRGNTELLLRRLERDDPRRRYGEDVVRATVRAEALTLQLLAFSRHQPFDPRPLDLALLVAEFRSLLAPLLREDVVLEMDTRDGPFTVLADHNQVEQVLLNLAVNARDAMPRGGRIRISLERLFLEESSPEINPEVDTGGYVRLTVEDSGVGIPPEVLPRIFEPFFTTKGPGEGTGLGLSVVYGIVRRHKGWVDVDSEPGRGSSFHVHFPATDAAPVSVPSLRGRDEVAPPAGGG
ncbi:MAG: hypothetical protein FJ098_15935, partial [Deltaproteobacteria bacterium]|nr:hypothetical protein [Deltaproteobacteria bacterium]